MSLRCPLLVFARKSRTAALLFLQTSTTAETKTPPQSILRSWTDFNQRNCQCIMIVPSRDFSSHSSGKSDVSRSAEPANKKVYSLREIKSAQNQQQFYYDRNFITALRAMRDFLLKPEHLEGLRVTSRRSPHDKQPPLHVYWRKDVEAKSIQVWGSLEALEKERERRSSSEDRQVDQRGFMSRLVDGDSKRQLRAQKVKNWPVRTMAQKETTEEGLESQSGRVVLSAVAINTANFFGKLIAWIMTGSHAMFSEAIHSAADTLNQLILVYGIRKSVKKATEEHPYGYSNMQYVASLISGVGIFCLGAGVSVYHGVTGLYSPQDMGSMTLAFAVLSMSFVSECVTLILAIKSIRESAAQHNMTFTEFVEGGYDPCVNVVLLEDMAAVMGVMIAGGAMGMSTVLGSHIPDAVGSVLIGGLLGTVASFMIYTNATALVGRSIPEEKLMMINKELEGDIMVRHVMDVKGIDMGNGVIRYKAEVDVDGRELAKYYLRQKNLPQLLEEVKGFKTEGDLESFLLKHGENIVDCLGEQVDRIELNLKQLHPELVHVDLEVL